MGKEQEIFDDLARLCASPGYAHAIAYLCFRDNMVFYDKKEGMTADDMRPSFSSERLIRTELSTLVGLLVKEDIDYTFPDPSVLRQYLGKTETLLKELHDSMLAPVIEKLDSAKSREENSELFTTGEALREPIFYGGESAYSCQYRELAPRKYIKDSEWLEINKGISIENVRDVAHAVQKIQNEKLTKIPPKYPDRWPLLILTGYTFTIHEVANYTGIEQATVEKILTAFAVPAGGKNAGFRELNDFNVVNETPLIRYNNDSFILFQQFSLVEAMYESPSYWMCKDDKYAARADGNRGKFTEEFCRERLEFVFGKENVYPNVKIIESKKDRGEIDVLVLFGDRAIVLQAKSKRLTLKARKGNDEKIREDFKKSIQDSYAQGYRDAEFLGNGKYRFIDSESNEIVIPNRIKEIYILCVVSDHYPALSYQTQEFLRPKETNTIRPPFVMDVFTLDSMTEMLQSPLLLLSYIHRRVTGFEYLFASHESRILSYHIKNNLWLEDGQTPIYFKDDLSSHLETAMTVRRESFPGARTPPGFLACFETTDLGRIVKTLDENPTPATLDLGFTLLSQDEAEAINMVKNIENVFNLPKKKGASTDIDTQARSFLESYSRGDAILSRARNKTGRNAPCPCGSGRKYKKCCMAR